MRLIDGDKLISVFETAFNGQIGITINEIAKEMLETQEEIDAISVVRCKDCKHRISVERFEGEYGCNHENGLLGLVEDNYFCFYGERKDDKND